MSRAGTQTQKPKLDKARADRIINFAKRLCHTSGEWKGKPFIPMRWQANDILRPLFGTVGDDGNRWYRQAYVSTPRKNGKSELAAVVALYLLMADNEPSAEIYSAARDRAQAAIVFRRVQEMVMHTPFLRKALQIYTSSRRIVYLHTGSFYQVISADAGRQEGLNAHGVIFDELHTQRDQKLWDVLSTSMGARRQPLIFAITTAGDSINSICYQVRSSIQLDPHGFFYEVSAPEKANPYSLDTWLAANPGLQHPTRRKTGFRKLDEIKQAAERARVSPTFLASFRRYYLNQWVALRSGWMDPTKWEACPRFDEEELKGRTCWAGLDLASVSDFAAFVLVCPLDDGRIAVKPHFYLPEETAHQRIIREPYFLGWKAAGHFTTTPGEVLDYAFIRHDIEKALNEYNISAIAFDRWNASHLVQELLGSGAPMVEWATGYLAMNAPILELEKLVLSQRLAHNNHPILSWMSANTILKTDPMGRVCPDKRSSSDKIDGIVALAMAIGIWIKESGLGEEEEPAIFVDWI